MAFYTWDAVKPDGSRIVQAMRFLPQINVLDLRTGKLFGSRLKGAPGFSLMKDVKRLTETVYYTGVCADDRYIYAVFRERGIRPNPAGRTIISSMSSTGRGACAPGSKPTARMSAAGSIRCGTASMR